MNLKTDLLLLNRHVSMMQVIQISQFIIAIFMTVHVLIEFHNIKVRK